MFTELKNKIGWRYLEVYLAYTRLPGSTQVYTSPSDATEDEG